MKSKNVKNPISEKSGFYDPIKIKSQVQEEQPKNGQNSPWDFRAPQYDQRSSNFINAGTHYGEAHKQPVGHAGEPKQNVPCLPRGNPNTMRDDEKG